MSPWRPGSERALGPPKRGDFPAVLPEPGGQTGEVGGAKRGRFGRARPHHRHAQQVALELHEPGVTVAPPSTRSSRKRSPRVGLHRREQVGALEGDALERGAGHMRRGGAARQADDGAAGGGVPMRRARGR